jgi:hypothetical protein
MVGCWFLKAKPNNSGILYGLDGWFLKAKPNNSRILYGLDRPAEASGPV